MCEIDFRFTRKRSNYVNTTTAGVRAVSSDRYSGPNLIKCLGPYLGAYLCAYLGAYLGD